jgi:glycerophosphoryl diester phosphodiesterase
MERLLLERLRKNRLDDRGAADHTPVIIQSFSPESLKKLSLNLKTKVPLVFLVSDENPGKWLTATGLAEAKQFAEGVGPAKALVDPKLVTQAHSLGLTVTPYTFRSSNTGKFKNVREEMSHYLYNLGVDALFTDNPDMFPRTRVESHEDLEFRI